MSSERSDKCAEESEVNNVNGLPRIKHIKHGESHEYIEDPSMAHFKRHECALSHLGSLSLFVSLFYLS